MLVWLLKEGENLPVQGGARKMRAWMLAEELVSRGHSVVWWASTFSHQRKSLLFAADADVEVAPRFRLRLLHAGTYRRNFSVARYRHHRALAARFRDVSSTLPAPDVIVSAFPPIDFAHEAVRYGHQHSVPTIVDIRDLWPDTYLDHLPPVVRPIARALLQGDYRKTARSLRLADSLVAISHGCLDWGLQHAGRAERQCDRVLYTGYPEEPMDALPASSRIAALGERLTGKMVCIYVGTFGRTYELQLVLDAAEFVFGRVGDRVHFLLAGDGEQMAALIKKASQLSNVTLSGWVDGAEIWHLLSHSDVGLMPIRGRPDTMPNKAFEYFSAGLPVLSSVEGEMELLLETSGAGRSYPPGDPRALAALVLELAEDRELRRSMGDGARRLFADRFGARTAYAAYADHVEAIAGRGAVLGRS